MTNIQQELETLHSRLAKCLFPLGFMLTKRKLNIKLLNDLADQLDIISKEARELAGVKNE